MRGSTSRRLNGGASWTNEIETALDEAEVPSEQSPRPRGGHASAFSDTTPG